MRGHKKGGSAPQVIEANGWQDCPQRTRDFEVDGFWPKVLQEITADSGPSGCNTYITYTDGDGLYQVWRADR